MLRGDWWKSLAVRWRGDSEARVFSDRQQTSMPIDINQLRVERGGNPDVVRESQKKRFASVDLVDQVIALDEQWRKKNGDWETMKMNINALQSQIKDLVKAKKQEEAQPLIQKRKELAALEPALKVEADALKEVVERELSKIGNLVDPSVPVSQNEDDNEVVATWGACRPHEDSLHYHHEVLHRIDGYEPEKGVAVAGHRAYFLKGYGVMLNQALIMYGQSFLMQRKYTLLQPPYFMNKEVMAGVAQLSEFDEALYKVTGADPSDEKYLIATSEQPMCGFHKDEWITESALPIRYAGSSTCFRKEAGSHGKDTWGIFRVHQFEKVEQFVLCEPEKSEEMLQEMISTAEAFYQSLGLPYRVINIVSGELNNAATKKYDLEAWFPAYAEFRELVSASNCTDYQARAMEIRCGIKKMNQTEKKYVHLLNATLCATTRTICCILENNQTPEGVRVPDVLVPFMGGVTFLPFVQDAKVNHQAVKMQKAAAKKQ
ncbi:seryl-tRNA synthetase [Achlya hypogyna]|uniref:serine--tRNA ligase n=1 Tax=Achlya hypogyna TaxID=1202772 RepID=A0A1V9ZR28_ACHHY|nr:seryl-tRNA synthetase [Achlya hypogyna]